MLVLPYMGEQSLYQQFDLTQSVLNQVGDPQSMPLGTLYCPSDESQNRFYADSALVESKRFAKGNYAAFVSPYHATYADWWPSGLSGVHRYAPKNVLDGISNTLLLSEVRTRDNELDQRGAWALPWTGSTLLAFDMHDAKDFVETEAEFEQECLYSSEFLFHPSSLSIGHTQLPNTLGPVLDMLYRCPDPAAHN